MKKIYYPVSKKIHQRKRKKKISKKSYSSKFSDIQKNREDKETIDNNENKELNINQKSNNILKPNNGTELSHDRMISDLVNKNNNNINIKENVDINNFFVIFAFCCIRKRKNDNSYILEEGLNIIKERLDILNIFKILYNDEKFQDYLKNKNIEIEMSDNCKKKLQ